MRSLRDLEDAPWQFGFHAAMRRIESGHPQMPRWGQARHPSDEPARLGQDPQLGFACAPIKRYRRRADGRPDQLRIAFIGLFGSQGALPLHLTEHARDRMRKVGDTTFASFVDVFQHRLMVLFQRAWAMGQPCVAQDRASDSEFIRYIGALCGRGSAATRDRDGLSDAAKLQFAGRLAPRTRNAEGLETMVSRYFSVKAQVEPFVGDWVALHPADRWKLGGARAQSQLGSSTVMGGRRFERGHKFRLRIGPLARSQFEAFLPGRPRLDVLSRMVRVYVGDELCWDLELTLGDKAGAPIRLGSACRLGYNTWIGQSSSGVEQTRKVIVDPPNAA